MRYVKNSKGRTVIEYTPEEQVNINAYRRNLRLKIAYESMIQAQERYAELRALAAEQDRETVTVN